VDRIKQALSGLVGDGTITEEQSTKVAETLFDEREERREQREADRGQMASTIADVLGITTDELRAAHEDGDKTIADIASEKGVELSIVVDRIVEAKQAQLAEDVSSGRITQEMADTISANLVDRTTNMVSSNDPRGHGGHGPGRGGPGRGGPDGAATEQRRGSTTSSTADATAAA
jgi:hypothetical protein